MRQRASPHPAAGSRHSSSIPLGSRSQQSGTWFLMSRWGRALQRGARQLSGGPGEPHAVGAAPGGLAPQVSPALRWLPGPSAARERWLFVRVQGSLAVGSSGMSLALWEGAERRDSPCRRVEQVLTPCAPQDHISSSHLKNSWLGAEPIGPCAHTLLSVGVPA